MTNVPNRSRTVAIEVCFSFDFNLFLVSPSRAKLIGDVRMNRQNAAIRSMVFFLFYNAHCLLKGPKLEIFGSRVFPQIRPVCVGDLGTRRKISKF